MTGTIFDIKRYAIHDGPGIRTTVFFKSCPLNCWWCHNPESISPKIEKYSRTVAFDGVKMEVDDTVGRYITVEELFEEIVKDRLFYEESGGGVTFSGGEPFMQTPFLKEIAKVCHENGIHVTIDTSGHTSKKNIKEVLSYVDLFLYDLKLLDDVKHKEFTGVSNKRIIENLLFLKEQKQNVVIRFPIVPGYNDDEDNIRATEGFLASLNGGVKEIHLLPYHNIATGKYKRFYIESKLKTMKSIAEEELIPLKERFENKGYIVKIGG